MFNNTKVTLKVIHQIFITLKSIQNITKEITESFKTPYRNKCEAETQINM